MYQRPYIAIEQLYLICLSKAPRKALSSALSPEDHLSDVLSPGFRLGGHLFDYSRGTFPPLKLDGPCQLFFILPPKAFFFLFLGGAALSRLRFFSLDFFKLVGELGLLILSFLLLAKERVGVGLPGHSSASPAGDHLDARAWVFKLAH